MLEKCIELNSGEAVFYYMKALWMYHHSILGMMALGKLGSQEKKVSIMFALQNVEMALQLDPNWEEPRKLKKTLLKV